MSRSIATVAALACGLVAAFVGAWIVMSSGGDDPGLQAPTGSPFRPRTGTETRTEPQRHEGTASTRTELPSPERGDPKEPARPEIIVRQDPFGVAWAAVTGRVIDRQGNPLAEVRLALFADDAVGGQRSARGRELGAVVTGEDGAFRFDEVEARMRYVLHARHADHPLFRLDSIEPEPGQTLVYTIEFDHSARFEGRVVDAATGAPIADAEITAFDLDENPVAYDDAIECSVRSDSSGEFVFDRLVRGNKRFLASAPGYATANLVASSVEPGRKREPAVMRLERGLSIRGIVRRIDGEPVSGASVDAMPVRIPGSPNADSHYPAVRTAADGRFEITGLAEGLYVVRAQGKGLEGGRFRVSGAEMQALLTRGFQIDRGPDGSYGLRSMDGGRSKGRTIVTGEELTRLRGRDQEGIDAHLVSSVNAEAGDDGVELWLAATTTVAGRVVDAATGRPITAFKLLANPGPILYRVENAAALPVVDPDGRFDLPLHVLGTRPGSMWIFALATGYAGGSAELAIGVDDRGQVAPVPGQGELVIRMKRGASIAGRVVDRSGAPLADARVTAFAAFRLEGGEAQEAHLVKLLQRRVRGTPGAVVRSDESGRFELANVRSGNWYLRIEHEGHAAEEIDEIVVGDDGRIELGDIRLFEGGRVWGALRRPDGSPEEGVKVRLQSATMDSPSLESMTGMDGVYSFENVHPGSWQIAVIERGGRSTLTLEGLGSVAGQQVLVEEKGQLRIDL